jgi:hypothetical protein
VVNQCTYSIAVVNQCAYGIAVVNQCTYSIAVVNQCTYGIAVVNQCTYSISVINQCGLGVIPPVGVALHHTTHACQHVHSAILFVVGVRVLVDVANGCIVEDSRQGRKVATQQVTG